MTIKGDYIRSIRLFGYNFLIWKHAKKLPNKKSPYHVGTTNGACKLVKHNEYVALAMPSGDVIPFQVGLQVDSPLDDVATATVKVFVDLD
jgi:hypothetical protein